MEGVCVCGGGHDGEWEWLRGGLGEWAFKQILHITPIYDFGSVCKAANIRAWTIFAAHILFHASAVELGYEVEKLWYRDSAILWHLLIDYFFLKSCL